MAGLFGFTDTMGKQMYAEGKWQLFLSEINRRYYKIDSCHIPLVTQCSLYKHGASIVGEVDFGFSQLTPPVYILAFHN
jgi:hypothetical protein